MKIISITLILSIVFLVQAKPRCYKTTVNGDTFYLSYDDGLIYGSDDCDYEWDIDGKYFKTKKSWCMAWQNCDRYLGISPMSDELYEKILDLLDIDKDKLKKEEIGSYVLVVKEEPDQETDQWAIVEHQDGTYSIENIYLNQLVQNRAVALRDAHDSSRTYGLLLDTIQDNMGSKWER